MASHRHRSMRHAPCDKPTQAVRRNTETATWRPSTGGCLYRLARCDASRHSWDEVLQRQGLLQAHRGNVLIRM